MPAAGKKPSKTSSIRPKSSGPSLRPSSSGPGVRSKLSKPNIQSTASKSSIPEDVKPKKGLEWALPAYSICPKQKKGLDWDAIQKRVMRRHAPKGEDIKQIKVAIKELKNKKIPIHDFITLVSPYTADNGEEMRSVLADDINAFQRMTKRVYDTMTKDVNDVLTNEQVATQNFYQERHDLMTGKMMRAINEIYAMAPEFDFEKFYKQKGEYLERLFPLPEKVFTDADTDAVRKRQEAYHRLQWLRNEGERMSEENRRLQARLNQLKELQEIEQRAAQEAQAALEAQRVELEKEENKMRNQLHQLNENVERSIIENEDQEVKNMNDKALASSSRSRTTGTQLRKKPKSKKRPEWVTVASQEMENNAAQDALGSEAAALPPPPNIRKLQRDNPDRSYHQSAPGQRHADVIEDTIVERANVTKQKKREIPITRRNLAPKDTWSGFR